MIASYCRGSAAAPEAVVPAIFIFGDSLADAGNNNKLRTLAKANHPPYGQDFPGHIPTGRFVNGYNALDYLAFHLGLPSPPIYADPATKGAKLLQGVNFASAASGIQPYTGFNFGRVFSLDAQIQQFGVVKEELNGLIGVDATNKLLAKSVFYIVTGSNDWLNTYFFPASPLPGTYTLTEFRDLLVSKLLSQVQEMYNMGARRVAVAGLGAVGCCPSQMRAHKSINGTCVDSLNDLAMDFNDHLRPQLLALSDSLPSTTFAFQNLLTPLLEVKANPTAYGFTLTDQACCGIGKYGGFLNCFQGFPVCNDVENHLYWDAYHPTSKFQKQFVDLVWNNGPPYSYPISGKQLLQNWAGEDLQA